MPPRTSRRQAWHHCGLRAGGLSGREDAVGAEGAGRGASGSRTPALFYISTPRSTTLSIFIGLPLPRAPRGLSAASDDVLLYMYSAVVRAFSLPRPAPVGDGVAATPGGSTGGIVRGISGTAVYAVADAPIVAPDSGEAGS